MRNNFLKDERGYAMIEVLLGIMIIAILTSAALSNLNNSFKTVYSNYVITSTYSKINFIRAFSRIDHPNFSEMKGSSPLWLYFYRRSYFFYINRQEVFKQYLSPNFSFDKAHQIKFMPNSMQATQGHINLYYGSEVLKPAIVINNAGRVRITYDDSFF